jgi:ornithine carbamoyltransferase
MDRSFLTLTDVNRDEFLRLLELGRRLKAGQAPVGPKPLDGKTLLLLFRKPSTRTRVSFQVGMWQLGGQALDLRAQESQIDRGEPIEDTARVLSRYADGLVVRTFSQGELEAWRAHGTLPVINGLSDRHHPCQILADIQTIREHKGRIEGLTVAYIGDGNNVLNSWITAACLADFDLVMCTPPGYDPDPTILEECGRIGFAGRRPRLVRDPREAAAGADVLYTDVWTSMGQEEESARRRSAFRGFSLDEELVALAKPDVSVMHCLPAHRGEEISAGVVEGPRSVIFDQAENRLHMQKALLLFLLSSDRRWFHDIPPGDTA